MYIHVPSSFMSKLFYLYISTTNYMTDCTKLNPPVAFNYLYLQTIRFLKCKYLDYQINYKSKTVSLDAYELCLIT